MNVFCLVSTDKVREEKPSILLLLKAGLWKGAHTNEGTDVCLGRTTVVPHNTIAHKMSILVESFCRQLLMLNTEGPEMWERGQENFTFS